MNKTLQIGLPRDAMHDIKPQNLFQEFEADNIKYVINKSFKESKLQLGLQNKEIDIAILPLNLVPIKLKDGVCITALTGRDSQEQQLIVNPNKINLSDLNTLEGKNIFGYTSPVVQSQFSELFPQAEHRLLKKNELKDISSLDNSDFAGVVMDANSMLADRLRNTNHPFRKLSTEEIIPTAGTGALAYITRMDDIPVRSILKRIHSKDVSERTNIERKVMSGIKDNSMVACYVDKDKQGNFHAFAVCKQNGNKLSKVQLSQTTTYGMADKIIKQLMVPR